LAGRKVLPHIFRIAEPDAGRRANRESWLSRQYRPSSWRITRTPSQRSNVRIRWRHWANT
jgi:hypothetical protein